MVVYREGGLPGMLLTQRQARRQAIDSIRVQLVPIRPVPRAKISGPRDVSRLVAEMEDYDREYAKVIHLDTKNQVMGVETISIGSLSASIVHPRETVKGAILNNSASTIFVHNHPSGVCTPSADDDNIHRRLTDAFELVGIDMLDSVIVGKGCLYSFKEGEMVRVPVQAPLPMIGEDIMKLPLEERRMIARQIAATTGQPVVGVGRTVTVEEVKKLPGEEKTRIARGLAASIEVEDKVQFITALTDYITAGADLEKRKRAFERLQASRYYNKWFTLFFYEHDRQRAMQHLMNFFKANEQGLGFLNYTYYGFITEYLKAIASLPKRG